MKIVILDGYTLNPGDLSYDGLNEFGEVVIYDRTPQELIVSRIGDAEAIFTNKVPISRETLEACPNLKYVGVFATGYNVVDVVAAKEKGVIVTNIPSYGTGAVAQFTIALLLEACHHIGEHSESVKAGGWVNCEDFCYWNHPLVELAGKTMGVIGFGRIGQDVAKLAQAFGMNVCAYGPRYKAEPGASIPSVSLDELYAKSDVIALHCPLTDETKGVINKDSISKMKDGVIIVNSSRGALIVEKDLREALDAGKVAYAAVDVLSTEPPSGDNPLLGAKNCIITPHIAWAPIESRTRLLNIAIENIKQFVNGTPQNVVSK
jgi:glycerate dehydrogenase